MKDNRISAGQGEDSPQGGAISTQFTTLKERKLA